MEQEQPEQSKNIYVEKDSEDSLHYLLGAISLSAHGSWSWATWQGKDYLYLKYQEPSWGVPQEALLSLPRTTLSTSDDGPPSSPSSDTT